MSSDFDGDGFADLATGTPREDIGGIRDVGSVTVLYGTAQGLRGARSQLWHEGSTGVPGDPSTSDLFGFALAAGDIDGDGYADLVIGSPFEAVGTKTNAGAIVVLYGTDEGLGASGAQRFTQDTAGLPDVVEKGDQFGYSVAAGDLGGDGFVDIGFGVHREDLPGESGTERANAGAVQVLYGSAEGVATSGGRLISQATAGIPDDAERGDAFGSAIVAADFDGDGSDDLAVGGADEDVTGARDAGIAIVIPGGSGGIDPSAAIAVHQARAGVADEPENGDLLGWALAAGDLDGDGRDDLAAGVHGETISGRSSAGAVHVIPGSADGIRPGWSVLWHQDVANVAGTAGTADAFGKALASGDLNDDGHDDLAIGARYDEEGGALGAGVVHVLFGSATGLTPAASQLWTQTATGVGETGEEKDHFGSILAIAHVRGGVLPALVIGTHFESLGGATYAGVFHVLAGGTGGPTASGAQLWSQDSTDVPEQADANDFFPFSLAGH
ncbi:MAG: hypothetical protein WD206_08735 [Actinomycetota bacterium]